MHRYILRKRVLKDAILRLHGRPGKDGISVTPLVTRLHARRHCCVRLHICCRSRHLLMHGHQVTIDIGSLSQIIQASEVSINETVVCPCCGRAALWCRWSCAVDALIRIVSTRAAGNLPGAFQFLSYTSLARFGTAAGTGVSTWIVDASLVPLEDVFSRKGPIAWRAVVALGCVSARRTLVRGWYSKEARFHVR